MIAKARLGVAAPLLMLATLASCGGGGGGGAPAGGGGGGGPVLVETNDAGDVSSAQVAIDTDGNGLAVWIQSDGTRGNVWANRYTAGAGWGMAVLIETGTGNARSPQLAIDGSGNGLVVWDQSNGLIQHIWANGFTPATGWGTAVQIETGAGGAISPQLGVDAAGNALAVWSGSPSTGFNRYTTGSGWGTAAPIQTGTVNISTPHVAVAANGNAVAVWVQFVGLRGDVWANRYTATSATTGSWGTAALIETDNVNDAITPRVAIDTSGNALVVWVQTDGTRYNVWSNRFTAGATNTWGTAALIETDNAGGANAPRVAFDGSGNALAVWQQDGDASAVITYDIRSNRYTAGSGWGTSELMETSALRAGGVELAMNGAGAAVATWYQLDGSHQSVYSRRYAPGIGWGPVALAESYDGGDAVFPKVAINASGAGLLVWEQVDPVGGVRHDLWADAY
jgi:hypothetical protein